MMATDMVSPQLTLMSFSAIWVSVVVVGLIIVTLINRRKK